MTTPKTQAPLKTFCGDYYVGMTKAQAEKNGTYTKTIGLDFKDIDGCDGSKPDNVLQKSEILEARNQQAWRSEFVGLGQVALGYLLSAGSVIVEAGSLGTATPLATAGFYAGCSMITAGIATGLTGIGELDSDNNPETQSRWDAFKEGGKKIIKGGAGLVKSLANKVSGK